MQTLVDCFDGMHYIARFQRSGGVVHWTVRLFRDVHDAGTEVVGEILTAPNGDDDELVRMEVEDLIPEFAE